MSLRASIIIPTRGRDACLRQVLRDLSAQDLPAGTFDVWVVDQNSPPLAELSTEAMPVRLHHETMPPQGSHAARNRAIFATDAPLCIFVDDDVRLPPHFVASHLQAHDLYWQTLKEVAVVAGRVVQPKDGLTEEQMLRSGELARYDRLTGRVKGNFTGFELGFVDHIHECNFSARTEALRHVGGFNEAFEGNAYFYGVDLSMRLKKAKYRIMYRPDIVLTHLQEPSGGNRVSNKADHTYWQMRNLGLLNSLHMRVLGLPAFSAYALGYVLGKAMKNTDPHIAIKGVKGVVDGLRYFVPGARRLKLRF